MHIENMTSKEQMLRKIFLWASEAKQKSLELQKLFILEFSEEIKKNSNSECEGIAYDLFELSSILCDITEGCKNIKYNI